MHVVGRGRARAQQLCRASGRARVHSSAQACVQACVRNEPNRAIVAGRRAEEALRWASHERTVPCHIVSNDRSTGSRKYTSLKF